MKSAPAPIDKTYWWECPECGGTALEYGRHDRPRRGREGPVTAIWYFCPNGHQLLRKVPR